MIKRKRICDAAQEECEEGEIDWPEMEKGAKEVAMVERKRKREICEWEMFEVLISIPAPIFLWKWRKTKIMFQKTKITF